jgi:predicted dehydrogenase
MTLALSSEKKSASSAELANAITAADFSGCAATVVGYGFMGKHYVKALRALGVGQVQVCSRPEGPLAELRGVPGVTTVPGGYQSFDTAALPGELGIVATPTADLVAAALHLAACGFRKILIEKPVSLWSTQIRQLDDSLRDLGVESVCAYNRLAYPSFLEARARTCQEGGITSCTYTFTEIIGADWTDRYPAEELARWGIANSLHLIGMAHGLIGLPARWNGHRSGRLSWHPTGSVFVGSGRSQRDVPFAYQADWGSKGRWSVEVNTREMSYRLCPLERLYSKASSLGEWENVCVSTFDTGIKAGIAEQVAAMLSDDIRLLVPLISLGQTAALTAYGEELFGYAASPEKYC